MRKLAAVLAVLFALLLVFAGCGDKNAQEQKTSAEAVLSPSETETEPKTLSGEPLPSELVIPNTKIDPPQSGDVGTTSAVPSSTTKVTSHATRPAATTSKTTAKPSSASSPAGVELPDHNWN